jgi:hypothetical protein
MFGLQGVTSHGSLPSARLAGVASLSAPWRGVEAGAWPDQHSSPSIIHTPTSGLHARKRPLWRYLNMAGAVERAWGDALGYDRGQPVGLLDETRRARPGRAPARPGRPAPGTSSASPRTASARSASSRPSSVAVARSGPRGISAAAASARRRRKAVPRRSQPPSSTPHSLRSVGSGSHRAT